MKIYINNLNIRENSSGVKTYQINLIQELLTLDKKNRYFLICSKSNQTLFNSFTAFSNCNLIVVPLNVQSPILRILLDQLLVPLICFSRKSILISSQNVCSVLAICKQLLIIQGPLSIRSIRKEANFKDIGLFNKIYYYLLFKLSILKADQIISVSHYLKSHLKLISKKLKIKVVHEGVTINVFENKSIPQQNKSKTEYILFVSTLFKYKGVEELLEAYASLSIQHQKKYQLWIIGKDPTNGEYLEQLKAKAFNLNISNNIIFKGKVPHEEIANYYQNAQVFVYPSSIESFGLPPLEAMASGIPVIASNKMSIPEIVGDAAILIEPKDISSFSNALTTVLDNHQVREALINNGYENIKKFSWVRMSEDILDILQKI